MEPSEYAQAPFRSRLQYIPASQTVHGGRLQVIFSGFAQHVVENIANTNERHHSITHRNSLG
jgi:hypothetical protein